VKEVSVSINARMLAAEILGLFIALALCLFIPAGTFRWIAGWCFLLLFIGFVAVISIWLIKHDPGLLQERMTGLRRPDQNKWDRILMGWVWIFFILWLVIMPLDAVRFQWSHMPTWIQAIGAIVLIFSLYLFYLVTRENPYLSPAIRIQEERGQNVISTGPYHYIRHPYYAASILFFLGTTLMLGSWYGLILASLLTGLVVRRAFMEERTLQKELEGYDEYMKHVNHRFIPYIW
jgi:protein-S-isoprenylcysteine O-methyltransferase Ste14